MDKGYRLASTGRGHINASWDYKLSANRLELTRSVTRSTPQLKMQPVIQIGTRPITIWPSEPATRQEEINLCTIASSAYLLKLCALHSSILSLGEPFKLYICCMDQNVYSVLERLNLEGAVLIRHEDIDFPNLKDARANRSESELCWTLKPCLIEHIFETYGIKGIFYCDSDIYFFSSPRGAFEELGKHSVYLCPQRDLPWVEKIYGKYQAGLIGFSNNPDGRHALKWWREKCIDWCYSYRDESNKRWGDQKYLDLIPEYFKNVYVSADLGMDAAPWNIVYNNSFELSLKNREVYIEDCKLVAFHFACLDMFDRNNFDLWSYGTLNISNFIKLNIYTPYILALQKAVQEVFAVEGDNITRYFSKKSAQCAKTPFVLHKDRQEMEKWETYYSFCTIASEKYVLQVLALYLSLAQALDNFYLYVCCADIKAEKVFRRLKLKNVIVFSSKTVETEEFAKIAGTRDLQEYCWTLKPFLCMYILQNWGIHDIVYCDADMFFFAHPKPIWDEWKGYSIFLCRQRSTGEIERVHGIFQAGLVGFNTDGISLLALSWWAERCLEWCSKTPDAEHDRWGDQKYLNQLPYKFYSIKISENPGLDAAPWNLLMTGADTLAEGPDGGVLINGSPLIAYHFGSMRIFGPNAAELWKIEPLQFSPMVIQKIYRPYMAAIGRAAELVKKSGLSVDGLLEQFYGAEKYFNYHKFI